jgi:hypothetical protein
MKNLKYNNEIGKPLKLKGIVLPFELAKEILNTESKFIIICPYDKNFIQYVTDKDYYNQFGFPDTDCCIEFFVEKLCNKYILKYTGKQFRCNKSTWRKILREVVRIHKNKKA